MKTIHYSFLMCALLLLTEYVRAQTPVVWGASSTVSRNGSVFTATSSLSSITGTNSIAPNTNGWVKFKLNAAIGNCIVGFGFGDKANGSNQTFGNTFINATYNGGVYQCYKQNWTQVYHEWVNNADAAGTEIKVERQGATLNYYHNNVLKYTTSVATGIELIPVITFYQGESGKSVNVATEISQHGVGTAVPAVEYTYDDTGNRVRRRTVTVVLPRASKQEKEPITFSDFKLKVFPNPSDGHFEVTVEGDTEGLSFDVFDMAGKHVHKQPVAGLNTSVNVSHLSTGMYILTCRDAQKVKGQWKLLIQ